MTPRVGIGFDIHRLAPDRRLVLGGVDIPHEAGLVGHSDGDVLLHAVADALLGASGLGNIGERFPDSDVRYSGISSHLILREIVDLLQSEGFRIGNVDSNVLAERPRLLPYLREIEESIARLLGVPRGDVQVKAKTMEGLGPVGNGEAIAAEAVVLILADRSAS